MSIISILIANIIPLYLLIALGFIAGRWLDVGLESMARVAIYVIAPIVIFGAIARLEFSASYILLPLIFFGVSLAVTIPTYYLARKRWKSNTANLIGMSSVSGNTGYFGLPIVLAIYGAEWAGVYLFMNFAIQVAENTTGYFIAARGHHTIQESLIKVLKLPALHALYLGLLINLLHVELPDLFYRYWTYATGAWVFIGMMLIGIALGKLDRLEFSPRLFAWLFIPKFVLWPLATLLVIILDMTVFHLFSIEIYGLMLIFCSVPLMGNLVAFAAQLNLHPEKAAMAVLLSTLFAILYMPAIFWLAQEWLF